jgi:hypothetical protein
MVHKVHVDTAQSQLSSSNGSDWPSRPDRSTRMLVAARRLAASFQPRSAGSMAATSVTADG